MAASAIHWVFFVLCKINGVNKSFAVCRGLDGSEYMNKRKHKLDFSEKFSKTQWKVFEVALKGNCTAKSSSE